MWNISLTKADKRKCRELIHVGLERECEKYVKEMQKLASKPIPQAELNEPYREESGFSIEGPWHKRYIALYKKTASFDKHIAQRYDGMTGGHYLDIVLVAVDLEYLFQHKHPLTLSLNGIMAQQIRI